MPSALVELSEATHAGIERIANERGTSTDAVLSSAAEEYVRQNDARQQMRNEVIASLKDYQETGLHLTGYEVNEWFEKLQHGERVPLPECHT